MPRSNCETIERGRVGMVSDEQNKATSTPLPDEKVIWMQEVGIKEFARPMKYYTKFGQLYSEEYIRNTPLEKLKAGYERSLPVD